MNTHKKTILPKRLLALLLTAVMVISMLPAYAIAGDEDHIHAEECIASKTLICGYEECTEEPVLVCTIPEHEHDMDCYSLICDGDDHQHGDSCRNLVCTQEEHLHDENCYAPSHIHSEGCYEIKYSCQLDEEPNPAEDSVSEAKPESEEASESGEELSSEEASDSKEELISEDEPMLMSLTSGSDETATMPLVIYQQPKDVYVAGAKPRADWSLPNGFSWKDYPYAEFEVSVQGGQAPYTYQWYIEDSSTHGIYPAESYGVWPIGLVRLRNTTERKLFWGVVETEDNGNLAFCRITDAAGNVITSEKAALYTDLSAFNMTINSQPSDVTASEGDYVTFGVGVTGGKAPYTYQWHRVSWNDEILSDGTRYAGTYSSMMAIDSVNSEDHASWYYCVITDANGVQICSQLASLSVGHGNSSTSPLVIYQQPKDVYVAGAKPRADWSLPNGFSWKDYPYAEFEVSVQGGQPPYTYQWCIEDSSSHSIMTAESYGVWPIGLVRLRNTTESKLFWGVVETEDNGNKAFCRITDAAGNVITSERAVLYTEPSAFNMTISSQPSDVTAYEGDCVTFGVGVTGGKAPYTYQWYRRVIGAVERLSDGTRFTGTHSNLMAVDNLTEKADDETGFYCVVTDANGVTACSRLAQLSVDKIPIDPDFDLTPPYYDDESITLTAKHSEVPASMSATYRYQWYLVKDGISTLLGRDKELTITPDMTGYVFDLQLVVSRFDATRCTSESVTKSVRFTPKPAEITRQPVSQYAVSGSNVTFTAAATNAIAAEWYRVNASGIKEKLTSGASFDKDTGEATLTIPATGENAPYSYYCAFRYASDWTKSNEVTFCTAISLTGGGSVTAKVGNTTHLTVTKSGTCYHSYAYQYRWYKGNPNDIESATMLQNDGRHINMGPILSISNLEAADAGTYFFAAQGIDADHTETVVSPAVTLTVDTTPDPTKITTFTITGFDVPEYGDSYEDIDRNYSVPADANYTVEFYNAAWTTGVSSSTGYVTLKLKAKDGYSFEPNGSGDLVGTVNETIAKAYGVSSGATECTVTINFNYTSSWGIIKTPDDTVTFDPGDNSFEFVVNKEITPENLTASVTSCPHYDKGVIDEPHVVTSYSIYAGELPDGLALDKDTGKLNGTPTTLGYSAFTVQAKSFYGTCAYKDYTVLVKEETGYTPALAVNIKKVTAPVPGLNPDFSYTLSGTGAEKDGTDGRWYGVTEGKYLTDTDEFVAGQDYRFEAPVKAAAGYVFPINLTTVSATLNGNAAALTKTSDTFVSFAFTASGDTYHAITVNSGTASNTKAQKDSVVTITANTAPAGYVFDKWVVDSGSEPVTFANEDSVYTTFTMPDGAVSITATYVQVHTHAGTLHEGFAATCTADGEKNYFTCICGEAFEDAACLTEIADLASWKTIPATGHSYGAWIQHDANTHKKICTCGDTVTEAHIYGGDTVCDVCGYDSSAIAYAITDGANKTVTKGSETDILIVCNGELAKFTGVKVNGVSIAASNYTTVSGSTKLTLKKSYIETLSVGSHVITMEYRDGRAQTNLTVKAAPSYPNKNDNNVNTNNQPDTGEYTHIGFWWTLMLLSAVALILLYISKRKQKNLPDNGYPVL